MAAGVIAFFIVLAVTVGLFFLLKALVGIVFAVAISTAILILFPILNRRSNTTGLFKANMKAYFNLRTQGLSHKKAIAGTIASRYAISDANRSRVMAMFYGDADMAKKETLYADKGTDLRTLVYLIYRFEIGVPESLEESDHIQEKIAVTYRSLASQYDVKM
jgi:tryptophanase